MGKTTKKQKLADLQNLNRLQKEEMNTILGGIEKNSGQKKKRWLSFCGGILNQ
ncbi:MAG: hypothetical protein NXI23_24595 [Bacteroidetes bacterium]|nr:hypothetical protein [Bacteroidota bacterium]MDF1864195.1 hypothetical protein [Saprospiraceae bacterium]